jgi:hypothetical protein
MKIIYAEKYVSPRERPVTAEEQEVRRVAYALKVPTEEAARLFAEALAPLVDNHGLSCLLITVAGAWCEQQKGTRTPSPCLFRGLRRPFVETQDKKPRPTWSAFSPVSFPQTESRNFGRNDSAR